MLGRDYDLNCSIARTLELIGERWTLLILRDVFIGVHRFDALQADLGVARNILPKRLGRLVEEGVLERRRYQERPERFEYRLTESGLDLWPVLMALMHWGDKHRAPHGVPARAVHRGCGGELDAHLLCGSCGAKLALSDVEMLPGPGAAPARAA
ncbi:MAG: helix-turn-helix domain-containing protein [Solirubrobacteraceae bacterium]